MAVIINVLVITTGRSLGGCHRRGPSVTAKAINLGFWSHFQSYIHRVKPGFRATIAKAVVAGREVLRHWRKAGHWGSMAEKPDTGNAQLRTGGLEREVRCFSTGSLLTPGTLRKEAAPWLQPGCCNSSQPFYSHQGEEHSGWDIHQPAQQTVTMVNTVQRNSVGAGKLQTNTLPWCRTWSEICGTVWASTTTRNRGEEIRQLPKQTLSITPKY